MPNGKIQTTAGINWTSADAVPSFTENTRTFFKLLGILVERVGMSHRSCNASGAGGRSLTTCSFQEQKRHVNGYAIFRNRQLRHRKSRYSHLVLIYTTPLSVHDPYVTRRHVVPPYNVERYVTSLTDDTTPIHVTSVGGGKDLHHKTSRHWRWICWDVTSRRLKVSLQPFERRILTLFCRSFNHMNFTFGIVDFRCHVKR